MAAFMGASCVLCTIVGEAFKAACTGAWGSVLGAICILLGSGVVDALSENSLPTRLTFSYRFRFLVTRRHGVFSKFGSTLFMLSRRVRSSSLS